VELIIDLISLIGSSSVGEWFASVEWFFWGRLFFGLIWFTMFCVLCPAFVIAWTLERQKENNKKTANLYRAWKANTYMGCALFCGIAPWVLPVIIKMVIIAAIVAVAILG